MQTMRLRARVENQRGRIDVQPGAVCVDEGRRPFAHQVQMAPSRLRGKVVVAAKRSLEKGVG